MTGMYSRINDNDPYWLVKANTRIEGPMSFNQVLSKLTAGELNFENEVMSPLDRWRTLQSHPLFAAAVERLRRQNNFKPENTTTRSETMHLTRTLDINFETRTPAPTEMTPVPSQDVSVESSRAPVAPPVLQADIKKSSNTGLYVGTMALVVGAVISILVFSKNHFQKDSTVKTEKDQLASFFDKGFYHKQRGEWLAALQNFRQAHNLNSKDQYTIFELAPLLVQLDNQNIYARSILEKVSSNRFNPEDICLSRNASGLAYSYENTPDKSNYKKAVQKFDECLSPLSDEGTPSEIVVTVKLNKSLALMLMGRYEQAEALLASVKNVDTLSGVTHLFILLNYLYQGYYDHNKTAYEKAFQLSSQLLNQNFYDGYQEVLLFHAYAAYKLGKDNSYVSAALDKALNVDPDLTPDHYHSTSMDWRVFNWKYFDFICKDFKNFSKSDVISWLQFTCSYKTNNDTNMQKALDGWWNVKQTKSSALHISQALLFYKLGEYEKARDSLSTKLVTEPNALYLQVLSKVCVQLKDEKCLQAEIEKLSNISPLHALWAKIHMGPESERAQAVGKGLNVSKTYLPFLRAK